MEQWEEMNVYVSFEIFKKLPALVDQLNFAKIHPKIANGFGELKGNRYEEINLDNDDCDPDHSAYWRDILSVCGEYVMRFQSLHKCFISTEDLESMAKNCPNLLSLKVGIVLKKELSCSLLELQSLEDLEMKNFGFGNVRQLFESIKLLTNLKSLTLQGFPALELKPLKTLINLEALSLNVYGIDTLEICSPLKNLRSLRLIAYQLDNKPQHNKWEHAFLEKLIITIINWYNLPIAPELKYLEIKNNFPSKLLYNVAQNYGKNLKVLIIDSWVHNMAYEDTIHFGKFSALKELKCSVEESKSLEHIAELEHLEKLTLKVFKSEEVSEISKPHFVVLFRKCKKLRTLDISQSLLLDRTILKEFPHILRENGITAQNPLRIKLNLMMRMTQPLVSGILGLAGLVFEV